MTFSQLSTCMILCSALATAQQQPAPAQAPKPPAQAPKAPPSLAPPPAPVSPNAVVLTVGEDKLTRAQFEQLLEALAANGRPTNTPAAKRQVAQQLGELRALAQEARKRKLELDPAVQTMMAIQADQVLAATLSRQVGNNVKVDDAAMHAYYDSHKSQYEQVKASHILIRFKGSQVPLKPNEKDLTEEEALAKAQDIRKQIVAGGDFAALAKAESDDSGSGANGGSLGTFPRGQMVAQFEQAAFELPAGQLSQPVKTPFGYHIIKVDEHAAKSFEEAKPAIEQQMKPQLTREALEQIQKQAHVTMDEAYFGK